MMINTNEDQQQICYHHHLHHHRCHPNQGVERFYVESERSLRVSSLHSHYLHSCDDEGIIIIIIITVITITIIGIRGSSQL